MSVWEAMRSVLAKRAARRTLEDYWPPQRTVPVHYPHSLTCRHRIPGLGNGAYHSTQCPACLVEGRKP